jgi:hypothetical protein
MNVNPQIRAASWVAQSSPKIEAPKQNLETTVPKKDEGTGVADRLDSVAFSPDSPDLGQAHAAKLKEVSLEAGATSESEVSKTKNLRRLVRRGFLSAASTVMAGFNGLLSIPVGIQIGLDTVRADAAEAKTSSQADAPGGAAKSDPKSSQEATSDSVQEPKKLTGEELKRLNAARISTLSSVAATSAIGCCILGPVGGVVGAVVGYLTGTIGNHLEAKSGIGDQKMEKITADIRETVGESKGIWAKTKAFARGATSGAVHGYKSRKTTSKIQMSGILDGVGDAVKDWKKSKSEPVKELSNDSQHGTISKLAMAAAGGVFATAGVMINAPGGLVIGILESLKETTSYVPSHMTKNVMLWATNVGKFLPAAIVSATCGVAAGTAVGVATASVTSMIDGRLGVNRKIAKPVEDAVKEAHGEDEVKENLRAYYRAGKGSVVGLSAGIREGWKAGFQGGVEMVGDALATTPEAIETNEKVGE